MIHGDGSGEPPGPASGRDPLLELVADGMRGRVEPRPVDNDALLAGARSGAARIRRRRRLAGTAAAVVVLAVPISVLGRDMIGGLHSSITAGGVPSTGRTSPTAAQPPMIAPGPDAPTASPPPPFVLRLRSDTGGQTMSLSFAARTLAIAGTAASSIRPVVTASGGDPGLRHQIQATLNERIAHLTDTYRAKLIGRGLAGRQLTQTIQARTTTQWRHTVSVILDVTEQYPNRSTARTSAVVLDNRTGIEIAPQDLFTNIMAVDQAMRGAVRAAAAPAPALDQIVTALSMRPGPDGATDAFTWYPTPTGLRWACASDAVATTTGHGVDVTVPWSKLNPFLATTAPPHPQRQ